MRPLRGSPTLALLLLAATLGCTPPESDRMPQLDGEAAAPAVDEAPTTTLDPFAFADELLERRDAMERVEGELVMGDASATFVAWLHEGEPAVIEESVSLGDYGQQDDRYVLAADRLVLYESSGTRTVTDPARPPGEERVEVVLTFDADGSPLFTAMTVDGHSVEVVETRIQGALERAATLRRAALDAGARTD